MRRLFKCPIPSTCTTAVDSTPGLSHMLTVTRIQRPWHLLKRVSRRCRTHSRPRVQGTRAQSRIWVLIPRSSPYASPVSACASKLDSRVFSLFLLAQGLITLLERVGLPAMCCELARLILMRIEADLTGGTNLPGERGVGQACHRTISHQRKILGFDFCFAILPKSKRARTRVILGQ